MSTAEKICKEEEGGREANYADQIFPEQLQFKYPDHILSPLILQSLSLSLFLFFSLSLSGPTKYSCVQISIQTDVDVCINNNNKTEQNWQGKGDGDRGGGIDKACLGGIIFFPLTLEIDEIAARATELAGSERKLPIRTD